MAKLPPRLSPEELQRVVATAWDDRPPYRRTLMEHGIAEGVLVALMRQALTPNAFKTWKAKGQGGAAAAPAARAGRRPR